MRTSVYQKPKMRNKNAWKTSIDYVEVRVTIWIPFEMCFSCCFFLPTSSYSTRGPNFKSVQLNYSTRANYSCQKDRLFCCSNMWNSFSNGTKAKLKVDPWSGGLVFKHAILRIPHFKSNWTRMITMTQVPLWKTREFPKFHVVNWKCWDSAMRARIR